jgi:inositol phosphorylceramide mannosyltransferase catalytic subunit
MITNDGHRQLLDDLYKMNFVLPFYSTAKRMPRKIHQIWLSSPFPEKYQVWADTWKKFNPGWEYKLWTDVDINDVEIPNRELFNSITHVAQKSDFLRYHILNQFGGIYIDTDFECLKSFNSLSFLEFFAGVGYPEQVELYIGLIGSIPHHPILERLIKEMKEVKYEGSWRKMFNTTGSYFFTRVFFEVITECQKGIVPFPTDYFYPFPSDKRNGENYKNYIKDCSYAIHHWEVSWSRSKLKQN